VAISTVSRLPWKRELTSTTTGPSSVSRKSTPLLPKSPKLSDDILGQLVKAEIRQGKRRDVPVYLKPFALPKERL